MKEDKEDFIKVSKIPNQKRKISQQRRQQNRVNQSKSRKRKKQTMEQIEKKLATCLKIIRKCPTCSKRFNDSDTDDSTSLQEQIPEFNEDHIEDHHEEHFGVPIELTKLLVEGPFQEPIQLKFSEEPYQPYQEPIQLQLIKKPFQENSFIRIQPQQSEYLQGFMKSLFVLLIVGCFFLQNLDLKYQKTELQNLPQISNPQASFKQEIQIHQNLALRTNSLSRAFMVVPQTDFCDNCQTCLTKIMQMMKPYMDKSILSNKNYSKPYDNFNADKNLQFVNLVKKKVEIIMVEVMSVEISSKFNSFLQFMRTKDNHQLSQFAIAVSNDPKFEDRKIKFYEACGKDLQSANSNSTILIQQQYQGSN